VNRWISAVDRTIVLIFGIALLAAGAYAIAWDAGASLIRTWVSRLDREVLFGLPEEPWWHWVLSGTFVLCVFTGFGLLYLNLRRRRTSAGTWRHSEAGTDVSVDLGPVADGVASELAQLPGVRSTRSKATVDRGLPTLSVVVTADPAIDVVGFTTQAEGIARWTRRSLDGSPVAVQVLLHLDRVEATK